MEKAHHIKKTGNRGREKEAERSARRQGENKTGVTQQTWERGFESNSSEDAEYKDEHPRKKIQKIKRKTPRNKT